MRTYLRLYSSNINKIGLFFKQFIIINILFITSAYPLSNTPEQKLKNLSVSNSQIDSIIMQKAFEAELLVKNLDYKRAAKIYSEISKKSEDPEISKRATQIAGYSNNYEMMLESSERWLELSEDKITVRHVRISILLALNKIDLATKETLLAIKISKDKDKFALAYDTIKVFEDHVIKKIFDEVYKQYKDQYLANFYYVQVLLDNHEYEEALKLVNSVKKCTEFSKKASR